MNKGYINCGDMPMGLGMALSRNLSAMTAFSLMSPEEKQNVISGCHKIGSKEEMQEYVQSLANRIS